METGFLRAAHFDNHWSACPEHMERRRILASCSRALVPVLALLSPFQRLAPRPHREPEDRPL